LVGKCGKGFVLLVGAHKDDTEANAKKLAEKIATLRVFNDEAGKMNIALDGLQPQEEAQVLAVSNFTVYGDASGQRRPSFVQAAPYEEGERLFHAFVDQLRRLGIKTETGEFGADMQVELVNDGPVTLILDA
jgi:D-tyrosyl-tRNA(Tyr) deacylase